MRPAPLKKWDLKVALKPMLYSGGAGGEKNGEKKWLSVFW
jgi:hypothetical protein